MLVITGCARSGTKYIRTLLWRLGLAVGHERCLCDGIVSWTLLNHERSKMEVGVTDVHQRTDKVFHQVRHPLKVIASAHHTLSGASYRIMGEVFELPTGSKLLQLMRYWVEWNKRVEDFSIWRYRIEALPSIFEEFCDRCGVAVDHEILEKLPTNVNSRTYDAFTWDDLSSEDAELTKEIQLLATQYGYKDEATL